MTNDIGLLELVEPLVFNEVQQPIPLFNQNESIPKNKIGDFYGWGRISDSELSDLLQYIRLPIIGKKACPDPAQIYDMHQICVGYRNFVSYKGPCPGDSGGGLIVDGRLAALDSYGYGICGKYGKVNVFTEVAGYRDWIESEVKKCSDCTSLSKIAIRYSEQKKKMQ